MSNLPTARDLLALSTDYLAKQGCSSARLDAEVLLAHALQFDRVKLYMNIDRPLETEEIATYRRLIAYRGKRIPVAYLTGSKEFYNHTFVVNKHVLIPRPETELLVDQAVVLAGQFPMPQICEIGTGSGIIAVSIALKLPLARIWAVDVSQAALEIAKANADKLQVSDRITLVESNMFMNVPQQKYDVICSNPPYIPSEQLGKLAVELRYEPEIALDGGADGLDYLRSLIEQAPEYLLPGGFLITEIGFDQGSKVIELATESGFNYCRIVQDYAQKDRVVIMQWS